MNKQRLNCTAWNKYFLVILVLLVGFFFYACEFQGTVEDPQSPNEVKETDASVISAEFADEPVMIQNEQGRELLYFQGSEPIDITGLEQDGELPLILEVLPEKKNKVRERYGRGAAKHLPFVYARLNRGQLKKLNREGIRRIFPDMTVNIPLPKSGIEPELSESVPIIKDPNEWAQIEDQFGMTIDGTGTVIAILDTGIDASHPDLEGRILAAEVFTGEASVQDGHGHGTHVAGIAAGTGAASNGLYQGVAPNASIIVGKVLTNLGSGSSSCIINGIEWAVEQGADVINMSLGGTATIGDDPMSQAVNWAHDQGVAMVISAGNSGGQNFKVCSPAVAARSIAVAAIDKTGSLTLFSSRGPTLDGRIKPDIAAPGLAIVAPRAAGTAMGTVVDEFYTVASGTSMAAPHVAGLAALLKQAHPEWTSHEIKNALQLSARDLGFKLWEQGMGQVDATRAINVDIFFSNYGQINYGFINEGSQDRTFTLEQGQASLSEENPYFDFDSMEVYDGQDVSAMLALPDEVGGMAEIPISVMTPSGIYRAAALYFRTSRITAQVITSNSDYISVQPSQFFYSLCRPPIPYILTQNEDNTEMTALVDPGVYRFIAINNRITRTDGQLDAIPYVLSSEPITISSYAEQVHFDFQLDNAHYIPIDLSKVGTIAEAYNAVYVLPEYGTDNGRHICVGSNSNKAMPGLFVGDMEERDSVMVSIFTADTATGAMSKVYLLSWSLENVFVTNVPKHLATTDLSHFHITFNDEQSSYRSISFSLENINGYLNRKEMPDNFTVDLYTQRNPMGIHGPIVPTVAWWASTYYEERETVATDRAMQFAQLGPLPFPQIQEQTIQLSSGGTYPEAPASVTIDQSANPPVFDWDDVASTQDVTYQVYIGDGYVTSYVSGPDGMMEKPGPVGMDTFETMLFVPTSSYTPSRPLSEGKYKFWVRGIDSIGNLGEWSESLAFEITTDDTVAPSAPVLISPQESVDLSNPLPMFDWEEVPDETGVHYEFQLDNDADFSSPIISIFGIGSTIQHGLVESNYTPLVGLNSGVYYWRVRAIDGCRNFSDWSQSRSFSVSESKQDTTSPFVSIDHPSDGQELSGKVAIDISALDNVGIATVELYIDDIYKTSFVNPPYHHEWDTRQESNDNHTIKARALDQTGNENRSSIVVTVNNTFNSPPAQPDPPVGETDIIINAKQAYRSMTTDFDGDNLRYVFIWGDGTQTTTEYIPEGTQINKEHAWANPGTYSVTVQAVDSQDNRSPVSESLQVTVQDAPDTSSPSVSITNPAEGETISGPITVSVDAFDNVSVAKVAFYTGYVLQKEDISPPYEFLWDTTTTLNGSRILLVKAIDLSGNESTDSVLVQVDNMSDTIGPELFFLTPKEGQTVSGKIDIQVLAEDSSGVRNVEFFVDNQSLGRDTADPFTWSLNTNHYRKRGIITLTATAEDRAGNGSALSIQVNISH